MGEHDLTRIELMSKGTAVSTTTGQARSRRKQKLARNQSRMSRLSAK